MSDEAALLGADPALRNVCVARQPIFDARLAVQGYELLFRSGDDNRALVVDAEAATSGVILTAFTEIGLPRLVGGARAWINVSRRFLTEAYAMPLPTEQVVLEVLEDVVADDEVVAAAHALKRAGYLLALDDFTYSPSIDPLLELADIVKVEVLGRAPESIEADVRRIARFGPKQLLAEKVETHEEFVACRDMGFDLFQGYFLCEPRIVSARALAPSSLARLRMLARVLDPATEFEELADIVGSDVALSYKLLRYINSALFGLRHRIGSVRQALMLLGLEAIRRWVTLLVLAGDDDKPSELLTIGLVRARMCELLSSEHSRDGGGYFMVGMFSVLDATMDAPLEEVVGRLPLAPDITDALLGHAGHKGAVLRAVMTFERGDPAAALRILGADATPAQVQAAYAAAIDFAGLAGPTLRDPAPPRA